MNYAIVYLAAILVAAMLYWVVRGKKHYVGPLVEADVMGSESQERSSDDELKPKREAVVQGV